MSLSPKPIQNIKLGGLTLFRYSNLKIPRHSSQCVFYTKLGDCPRQNFDDHSLDFRSEFHLEPAGSKGYIRSRLGALLVAKEKQCSDIAFTKSSGSLKESSLCLKPGKAIN